MQKRGNVKVRKCKQNISKCI